MSLCINPYCPQPDHSGNDGSRFCQSCGSELILQERYRVMRLISDKSGFGRVYEAYDRNIPMILKVLKEGHSQNFKAVELFRQEALVLSQLKHPGVPAIAPDGYFQFRVRGLMDPLHCIIMEKIDGPNLREWMRQQGHNPISEKQALNWLRQIADVLHLVHQKNYFHRDIKPENVMLRSNGQLVLVDFGAAREMTMSYMERLGATGSVTRISSTGYTPPEQEKGQAVPQSDFYALGWTLIYLLTGRQPTDPDLYDSLSNEHHWRGMAPQVSPVFADLIDRLIATRAIDRPSNTQAILDELKQLASSQAGQPVQLTAGIVESAAAKAGGTIKPTAKNSPTVLQTEVSILKVIPRRNLWIMGGIAALILGLAGYGLIRMVLCWERSDCLLPSLPNKVASQPLKPFKSLTNGHTGLVNRIIFSGDGTRLISAGADKQILIWDVQSSRVLLTLTGHTGFINALALSDDGKFLASGGADNSIIIWDFTTGQKLNTLAGHTKPVNALLFNPDGLLVSGSADATVRIWNIATGESSILSGHKSFVNALDLAPDGKTLISGGADPEIIAWDITTGQQIRTFAGFDGFINTLAIAHNGSTLIAAGTDTKIHLWNFADASPTGNLQGHEGYVNNLVIKGDDRQFYSSDAAGNLFVWNLVNRHAIAHYTNQNPPLDHFTLSPDQQTLATGRGLTNIWLWSLPPIAH